MLTASDTKKSIDKVINELQNKLDNIRSVFDLYFAGSFV